MSDRPLEQVRGAYFTIYIVLARVPRLTHRATIIHHQQVIQLREKPLSVFLFKILLGFIQYLNIKLGELG